MAKLNKSQRVAIANKGARTKREKAKLTKMVQVKNLMGLGLSPHEIALTTGDPLKVIIDLIKLMGLSNNPYLKALGAGASGIGIISDIQKNVPNATQPAHMAHRIINDTAPDQLKPFLHAVIDKPESVRGTFINNLNALGSDVLKPFNDLNTYLGSLLSGEAGKPLV